MEEITKAAQLSVGRGVGFAALAISCVVMAVSFDLVLALKTAAGLAAILCGTLAMRGLNSLNRNFKRTEVWVLLDRKVSVSHEVAQRLIGGALRDAYYHNARLTGFTAAGLWVTGQILLLFR